MRRLFYTEVLWQSNLLYILHTTSCSRGSEEKWSWMNREDKIPGSVRSIHGYILTYSIPTKEDPLITRGSQQREPPFLRPWYPTAGQHQRTKGGSESFRNDLNSEFHSAHPHFEVDLFWMFSKNKKWNMNANIMCRNWTNRHFLQGVTHRNPTRHKLQGITKTHDIWCSKWTNVRQQLA